MDTSPIIPLRRICVFVTILHGMLLAAIVWVAPSYEQKTKPKQLVVQTVQLTPKKGAPIQNNHPTKKEAKVSPPPKPKAPPAPPKVEKKVEPVKSAVKEPEKPLPKPSPKPVPKSPPKAPAQPSPKAPTKEVEKVSAPPKKGPSQESLAAIREKLAAIPTTAIAMGPTISGEASSGETSLSYEEELSARLKILLKLPEMGEVRVALTLNRQGVVTKLEIISSKSSLNKKAVETHLPPIHFPPFGKAYPGESTHTFTLTLTNL